MHIIYTVYHATPPPNPLLFEALLPVAPKLIPKGRTESKKSVRVGAGAQPTTPNAADFHLHRGWLGFRTPIPLSPKPKRRT